MNSNLTMPRKEIVVYSPKSLGNNLGSKTRNPSNYESYTKDRSRLPHCLRRGSVAVQLLRLWVQIPPGSMDVCLL
jgi:hypothetical protein